MGAPKHIAVVDVGKTNKKVFVFDEKLAIVDSAYRGFEERVEDGVHVEDLDAMTAWIKGQIKTFAAKYHIAAISVTTHGATIVCVGKDGRPVVPPVAYTTDPGPAFDAGFYEQCGAPRELQRTTATAAFGLLINAAKTVRFVQTRYPAQFRSVETILSMPQYFGYVLTGVKGAEPTYVGCHTYLLDFQTKRYSVVADRLGIADKLPPLAENSWKVLGPVSPAVAAELGLAPDCVVTMGIHDSNSSLLPYLVKGYDNFVLNSTGTWCVAMHPTREVAFHDEEIGKLVFYNLDAFFNPIKTTIFMGGQEFDAYRAAFKAVNGRDDYPSFDLELCARIVRERRLFVLPSVVRGTGLFPDSTPRAVEDGVVCALDDIVTGRCAPSFFKNHETASAVLNLSLAAQSSIALGMAGYAGGGDIFTEGGFRRNGTYNAALAAMYPGSRTSTTRLEEATAFGAALLGAAALANTTPMHMRDLFEIEIVEIKKPSLPGLGEYVAEFKRRVNER